MVEAGKVDGMEQASNLVSRAKEIIARNQYLTLATAGADGAPWVSPVYAAFDEAYCFLWNSKPDARHSRNIIENGGRVAWVIFDSGAKEGGGEGVYFEGRAYALGEGAELDAALPVYYARKGKPAKPAADFLGASPRRMYKAIPERVWINSFEKMDGHVVDKRVEVRLG